ncbi:MAG TPA: hypothetical protein VKW76_17355 [Candidatus Binatia bacterium]|nr:hypothetical protein [Candidatus Binatia bacterium]
MRLVSLLVLLATGPAYAHSVPVLPSACTLDPIDFTEPATGAAGTVAPVGAADGLLVAYDTRAKTATFQFCPGTMPSDAASCVPSPPPAHAFSGDLAGSLSFPPVFVATLFDSGDLAAAVPLGVEVNGGVSVTSQPAFTTGLAAAGDVVAEGAPIDDQGRFTMVAVLPASALPAIVLRLAGQLTPEPDLDQFASTPTTTAVAGTITAKVAKLRVTFQPPADPDFAGHPTIVRVSAGGATIATADLPAGLTPHGKRLFLGQSADGGTRITARLVRRKPVLTYALVLRLPGPALPAGPAGRVTVDVTYATGGVLGRGEHAFRASRRGTRLAAP